MYIIYKTKLTSEGLCSQPIVEVTAVEGGCSRSGAVFSSPLPPPCQLRRYLHAPHPSWRHGLTVHVRSTGTVPEYARRVEPSTKCAVRSKGPAAQTARQPAEEATMPRQPLDG